MLKLHSSFEHKHDKSHKIFIVSMMCIPQLGVNLSSCLVFFCRQQAFSLADSSDSLSAYKLSTIT